jgi:asparagine synthetase B (glutamine-hydrolysing)
VANVSTDERYVARMQVFGRQDRDLLMGGMSAGPGDRYLLDVLAAGPEAGLDRLLHADTVTYLPEDLLVKMDRATMANSLEARSPLLDHEVVSFAAKLPLDRKARRSTSKVLLRSVAYRLIPRALVDRPKMGFAVPLDDWFDRGLGDVFADLVLGPGSAMAQEMDVSVARRLLDDHRAGVGRHGRQLWLLLMFEAWSRRWLMAGPRVAGGEPSAQSLLPPVEAMTMGAGQ